MQAPTSANVQNWSFIVVAAAVRVSWRAVTDQGRTKLK